MRKRLFSLLLALALTLVLPVSALAENGETEPNPEPQAAEETAAPEETTLPGETEPSPEPSQETEEVPPPLEPSVPPADPEGQTKPPEESPAPPENGTEETVDQGDLLTAAALSGTCGAQGDNLTWSITDGVLTIEGQGDMADYDYYGNTAPWSEAASSPDENGAYLVTRLSLSPGITSVGECAFYTCSGIEGTVDIPAGVTRIGENAFNGCAISSVTVPGSVETIGDGAFCWCQQLSSVTLSEGLVSIGAWAFMECRQLLELRIPDSILDIGERAAGLLSDGSMIDGFVLKGYSGSVAEDYAQINGIRFVSLGDTQNTLVAAGTCGAEGDNISWTLHKDGVLTLSGSGDMDFYGLGDAFKKYAKQVQTLVIEDGIRSVGNSAFKDTVNLKEVQLPDSVTEIMPSAFAGCLALEQVRLPAGLKTIGAAAFSGCSALEQIQLPQGLTRIMDSAFADCENLAGLKLPDSLLYLGEGALYGCKSLTEIYIPANVVTIGVGNNAYGRNAFDYSGIQAIEVDPENRFYRSMDGVLFNKAGTELLCYPQAKSDAAYAIPDGVTSIAAYAFFDCKELKELSFPEGLQEIGEVAFYFCTGLERLDLPEGLTKIADYAFYGCEGVTELNLPSTVTYIGEQAFSFDSLLLQSVTIPASVQVLGMGTFNLVAMKDLFILSPSCVIGEDVVWQEVTIHGYPGSTAEKYAAANGNPFVPIQETEPSPNPSLNPDPNPSPSLSPGSRPSPVPSHTAGASSGGRTPATGDRETPLLWAVLMTVSLLAAGFLLWKKEKAQ